MCGDRGDEDYAATVEGRIDWRGWVGGGEAFDHARSAGLGYEEGAIEIDCESAVECCLAGRDKRLVGYYSGGVDIDVDAAEVVLNMGDDFLDLGEGADIACVILQPYAVLRTEPKELVRRDWSNVDGCDIAVGPCED